MNTPLVPLPPANTYRDETRIAPRFTEEQQEYLDEVIIPKAMSRAAKGVREELSQTRSKLNKVLSQLTELRKALAIVTKE
jgi:hypothetical protein